MRPIGDAGRHVHRAPEHGLEQLVGEPERQHDPGGGLEGSIDGAEAEQEEVGEADPRLPQAHQEGAHHVGDRARGAHLRPGRGSAEPTLAPGGTSRPGIQHPSPAILDGGPGDQQHETVCRAGCSQPTCRKQRSDQVTAAARRPRMPNAGACCPSRGRTVRARAPARSGGRARPAAPPGPPRPRAAAARTARPAWPGTGCAGSETRRTERAPRASDPASGRRARASSRPPARAGRRLRWPRAARCR